MSDQKTILCFGDSLTWGWIPVVDGVPTQRYPRAQRWPGVMAAELGDGWSVIEEALSGRTTDVADPNDPRLDGSLYLPTALASHLPLDLVILMLGTNDTKVFFGRTPFAIGYGMAKLIGQVLGSAGGVGTTYPAPKCLVIAPPPLATMPHPYFVEQFVGAHDKAKALGRQYEMLSAFMKVEFLDAGAVLTTDGCDGLHFTAENNAALGRAVAAKVRTIFAAE